MTGRSLFQLCLPPALLLLVHTHTFSHTYTRWLLLFSVPASQQARGTDWQTGTYWNRHPTWTVVTHSINRSGHAHIHTLFCNGCVFCCVLSVDIATAACFLCVFHLKIIHTTRICLQNITASEWSNLKLADSYDRDCILSEMMMNSEFRICNKFLKIALT